MADKTYAQLRAELQARGFDYLEDTRCKFFINDAYFEICDAEPWSFLEWSITQVPLITIPDLAQVQSVVDTETKQRLAYEERRTLVRYHPDLTITGTPLYWYLEAGDTLKSYPVSEHPLVVHYTRTPAALENDGDVPIIPERFQALIVDGAALRAWMEDNEMDDAAGLRAHWDRGIERMRSVLLTPNLDGPKFIVKTTYNEGF